VFDRLRYRRQDGRVFLFVFNLLELNGGDMRREPLEVRKATLASVLAKGRSGLRFNDHCDDLPADVVFRHGCKLGFEGVVSKRLGSPYRVGAVARLAEAEEPERAGVKREAERIGAGRSGDTRQDTWKRTTSSSNVHRLLAHRQKVRRQLRRACRRRCGWPHV
jgi:hypothetical protein